MVKEVFLSLTYKFSPTISRKGFFQLPIVAADAPQSIVMLLARIHATPPQPMLSDQQQQEKLEKKSSSAVIKNSAGSVDQKYISSQDSDGIATASQNSSDTTMAVNPMLLKRRHVPAGTTYVMCERYSSSQPLAGILTDSLFRVNGFVRYLQATKRSSRRKAGKEVAVRITLQLEDIVCIRYSVKGLRLSSTSCVGPFPRYPYVGRHCVSRSHLRDGVQHATRLRISHQSS